MNAIHLLNILQRVWSIGRLCKRRKRAVTRSRLPVFSTVEAASVRPSVMFGARC